MVNGDGDFIVLLLLTLLSLRFPIADSFWATGAFSCCLRRFVPAASNRNPECGAAPGSSPAGFQFAGSDVATGSSITPILPVPTLLPTAGL